MDSVHTHVFNMISVLTPTNIFRDKCKICVLFWHKQFVY